MMLYTHAEEEFCVSEESKSKVFDLDGAQLVRKEGPTARRRVCFSEEVEVSEIPYTMEPTDPETQENVAKLKPLTTLRCIEYEALEAEERREEAQRWSLQVRSTTGRQRRRQGFAVKDPVDKPVPGLFFDPDLERECCSGRSI